VGKTWECKSRSKLLNRSHKEGGKTHVRRLSRRARGQLRKEKKAYTKRSKKRRPRRFRCRRRPQRGERGKKAGTALAHYSKVGKKGNRQKSGVKKNHEVEVRNKGPGLGGISPVRRKARNQPDSAGERELTRLRRGRQRGNQEPPGQPGSKGRTPRRKCAKGFATSTRLEKPLEKLLGPQRIKSRGREPSSWNVVVQRGGSREDARVESRYKGSCHGREGRICHTFEKSFVTGAESAMLITERGKRRKTGEMVRRWAVCGERGRGKEPAGSKRILTAKGKKTT